MKKVTLYLIITVCFLLPVFIARAISVDDVVKNMAAAYEKQMKDVKDYTMVTDQYTAYYKRAVVNGRTVYKIRTEVKVMAYTHTSIYDGTYNWSRDLVSGELKKEKADYDPGNSSGSLKSAGAKYAGTENVDGHKTHVLTVSDMCKMGKAGQAEQGKSVKIPGKMWIDAQDWVMRKMTTTAQGMETVTKFEDFRNIKGMIVSYRSVMTSPYPSDGQPVLSESEKKDARNRIAATQKEIGRMSGSEKTMAEAIINPQIKMAQSRVEGEFKQVSIIKEVKVNTGLSDALFDPKSIK